MSSVVSTVVQQFSLADESNFELKHNVFISKSATRELAKLIEYEDWGNDCAMLYKYLDYTWQFQLIDERIKVFRNNNQDFLLFHTGLRFRYSKEPVYILLSPNTKYNAKKKLQRWQATSERSFLTAMTLEKIYKIDPKDLPKPNAFMTDDSQKNIMFDESYSFYMNTYERILYSRTRIIEELRKNNIHLSMNIPSLAFTEMVERGISKGFEFIKKSPELIGKQLYVYKRYEKVTQLLRHRYRLELLVPLILNINNKDIFFVLVIRPNHVKKSYEGVSILTKEMAYSNARLIGRVYTSWLQLHDCMTKITECKEDLSQPHPVHVPVPVPSVASIEPSFDTSLVQVPVTTPVVSVPLLMNHTIFEPSPFDVDPFFYIATTLPLTLPPLIIKKNNE